MTVCGVLIVSVFCGVIKVGSWEASPGEAALTGVVMAATSDGFAGVAALVCRAGEPATTAAADSATGAAITGDAIDSFLTGVVSTGAAATGVEIWG